MSAETTAQPAEQEGASVPREQLLRIASMNVNGIRAAYKRGMAEWLAPRDVDVLCLQEVRAPDAATLTKFLQDQGFRSVVARMGLGDAAGDAGTRARNGAMAAARSKICSSR